MLILIWVWSLIFDTPMFWILALHVDFEGAKNTLVLIVLNWGFRWHWRFLAGVGSFILIWIWSQVFDTFMFQILALYLDIEGAENIHILSVLIWGFGGSWKFLAGVLIFYLDLDIVTGLWHTEVLNFGSLSWFSRCKNIYVLQVLTWGFRGVWRFLTGVGILILIGI